MLSEKITKNDLVSTLNGVKFSSNGRGYGNTTRIINNAIEQLFNGEKIAVKDYPDNYSIEKSEDLVKKIIKRIELEHPQIVQFVEKRIVDGFIVLYLNYAGYDEVGGSARLGYKNRKNWQITKDILKQNKHVK